jgi:hypothetical protein
MTTLVLDEKFERTAIGDVLSSVTDSVVEIRDEAGRLVAVLTFPAADDEGVDYAPHVAWAEQNVAELDRRARDPRPGLTTKKLLEGLRQRGSPE